MSHVAMAEHICPVCLVKHTHNTEILLHKQLKDIPEDQRVTGYGLCEEHQKMFDDGYIALVVASNPNLESTLTQETAERTGEVCHLRRSVFNEMFNTTVRDDLPMVFIEAGVFEYLKAQAE